MQSFVSDKKGSSPVTYGLIGEHLPHSFSKEIHRRCADYEYRLLELCPDEVAPFMESADFLAINVTIPYKQVVMPYLDSIHEAARAIGAVNTIVKRDGRLFGYNTDFYGLRALVNRTGISLAGKKVLILGTGGTAHTARAVAAAEGAREILTATRRPEGDYISYDDIYRDHTDAQVIFNTTPCGMYPKPDGGDGIAGCAVDISRLPELALVIDAVYNPLRTNLVLDARERGIPAEGGLYMLVAQGVVASRVFLGERIEDVVKSEDVIALCERIHAEVSREKENIVLTGMPGSGKTTVGRLLSETLERPFVDTDEEIVKRAGKPIADIFKECGEEGFRELEAAVIRDVGNEYRGAVIATGGGAILRDDNLRALRRAGRLYFLDRPLEDLLPTPDRPLASSAEAISRRYNERYPRYCATADVRISHPASPEDAVLAIRKDFFK